MTLSYLFCFQDCFTRVLKGHIDIAKAVFPNDTYGMQQNINEQLWLEDKRTKGLTVAES